MVFKRGMLNCAFIIGFTSLLSCETSEEEFTIDAIVEGEGGMCYDGSECSCGVIQKNCYWETLFVDEQGDYYVGVRTVDCENSLTELQQNYINPFNVGDKVRVTLGDYLSKDTCLTYEKWGEETKKLYDGREIVDYEILERNPDGHDTWYDIDFNDLFDSCEGLCD